MAAVVDATDIASTICARPEYERTNNFCPIITHLLLNIERIHCVRANIIYIRQSEVCARLGSSPRRRRRRHIWHILRRRVMNIPFSG